MKIEVVMKDKNGTPLEIGDMVEMFDWSPESRSLGVARLIWDADEGRVSSDPCLVDDVYDFWTKALPKCLKIAGTLQRIDIQDLPALPRRCDSVVEQLSDLVAVANRLGMFDAADVVQQTAGFLPASRYGCYCDLEPQMEPDGCVLDDGRLSDCIYVKEGMRKEQCRYWQIIRSPAAALEDAGKEGVPQDED